MTIDKKRAVLGQEAICPTGLGRVLDIADDACCINTYCNGLSVSWEWEDVHLLPIHGFHIDIPSISKFDSPDLLVLSDLDLYVIHVTDLNSDEPHSVIGPFYDDELGKALGKLSKGTYKGYDIDVDAEYTVLYLNKRN